MSGFVIVSNSASFERKVRRAAGKSGPAVTRYPAGGDDESFDAHLAEILASDPDVILIGPGVPDRSATELAAAIDDTHPEVSVVIIAEATPERWEEALHAGVRDIVDPGANIGDLRSALRRARDVSHRRRKHLVGAAGGTGTPGRVITIVAPKGGAGKTAVATNLGVGLARMVPGNVALIDLDLMFGDVRSVLRLSPEYTIADLRRTTGEIDGTTLKVFLTRRDGLYVLCGPPSPAEGEQVTEELVRATIDVLAQTMQYLIVDTSAGLSEQTLVALERASDIVLVCDLSVPAVEALAKLVHALDDLGLTASERHVVLNRADSRVGITLADVAGVIGAPIDVKLPSTRSVPVSMNRGQPMAEAYPRSAFSRQIAHFAEQFVSPNGSLRAIERRRRR